MKNLDLKDFLKDYTDDKGVIDFEKADSELTKQVNASTNSLLKKEKEKATVKLETEQQKAIKEFTTSDDSAYGQMKKELVNITTEIDQMKKETQVEKTKANKLTQINKIMEQGYTNPKKARYIYAAIQQDLADNEGEGDFNVLLEEYVKDIPPQKPQSWAGNAGSSDIQKNNFSEFEKSLTERLEASKK